MDTHDRSQLLTAPFTRCQALGAGISKGELASMLRDRAVRRMLHAVYVAADIEDTVHLRVAAVKLVTAPHVVISDRTAAWIHGVDALDYAELELLPPIDTCVPPGRTRVRRDQCHGRSRDLDEGDIMEIDGVLVTTPLRTALDLASGLHRRNGLAVLDAFLHLGSFNRVALHDEVRRFARRRGVIQLRQLVAVADGRAESPGESWTRLELIDAGLPVPLLQLVVMWQGQALFRLDLAYAKHRICVEYDGIEFHDSREQRRHDESRREWLRQHGWIVIVVRKDDFSPEAIERWTREVREALRSRRRSACA